MARPLFQHLTSVDGYIFHKNPIVFSYKLVILELFNSNDDNTIIDVLRSLTEGTEGYLIVHETRTHT